MIADDCVRAGIGKHRVCPEDVSKPIVAAKRDGQTLKVMNNFRTAFGSHFKAFDGCRRKRGGKRE